METNYNFEALYHLLQTNQLSALRDELAEMNVVDIADFLQELSNEGMAIAFRILPKDISADVFSYLDPDRQSHIVGTITDNELSSLLDDLFLDDTVDFLEEVPANVVTRVLANSDPETRKLINRFLQYPDNSAGSIMTIEMVQLHDRLTAAEAIDRIRSSGIDDETVYTAYCIDNARHLVGTLPLHRLLFAKADSLVRDLMDDDQQLIFVSTLEDEEDVADLARKYDLLSVPVVDNEKRLVGVITIDDIVDVIEEKNTEDFEKMALMHPSGTGNEYLKTGVFRLAGNRIVWLLVLMISGTFTGKIIENYQSMLSVVVGLTAAIPMLMDTGGNSGNQTSTLIIRGLALGEITIKDYFIVLFKELRVSLICGTVLAVVNFLRLLIFGGATLPVCLVICAALFCAVVAAKCIGCTLPIFAKLIHLDPALMAGPMITTIVDALTLAIYFALAHAFLL